MRLRHIRRRIERFCGRYFFRPKYGVSSLYNDQRQLKLPATYNPLQKGNSRVFMDTDAAYKPKEKTEAAK